MVLPSCPISAEASLVTGLTTQRAGVVDILLHKGACVESAQWSEVEGQFLEWLKKEAKTERGIFLAHNCSFDSRVLLRHASNQLK